MKYFSIAELCYSATADRNGITNTPSVTEIKNLHRLVDNILDPLRQAWGMPIRVNSGFRSKQVNTLVKGAKSSQHLRGQAADITAGSKELNKQLFDLAKSLKLDFDQLIDEKDYSWIHISYSPYYNNRRQILHLK